MKPSFSIASIICGTIILIAPLVSNTIASVAVAMTVAHINRQFDLTGSMPAWYAGAAFASGVAMLIVGVAAAFRRNS